MFLGIACKSSCTNSHINVSIFMVAIVETRLVKNRPHYNMKITWQFGHIVTLVRWLRLYAIRERRESPVDLVLCRTIMLLYVCVMDPHETHCTVHSRNVCRLCDGDSGRERSTYISLDDLELFSKYIDCCDSPIAISLL